VERSDLSPRLRVWLRSYQGKSIAQKSERGIARIQDLCLSVSPCPMYAAFEGLISDKSCRTKRCSHVTGSLPDEIRRNKLLILQGDFPTKEASKTAQILAVS
jgi:hypothetical protein